MSEVVAVEIQEHVAVVRIDDAKANVMSPAVIAAIDAALERAAADGLAVVLAGRAGRLSAGFDLDVMRAGPAAAAALVAAGGRLSLRLGRHPAPVVAACTGHALAMGAVLLLSCDLRIGARGAFKLGFNEVAIGLTTPLFLLEQARERMPKRHFQRAVVQAEIYGPEAAVEAGLLDCLGEPSDVIDAAVAEATRLAALPRAAFVATRARARGAVLDAIEAGIDADVAGLVGT